jgi:hypothetical protein
MTYKLNKERLYNLTPEIEQSIDAIYAQVTSLVKAQGKRFQISDVFNLVSATIIAVNSFFKDTDTPTKVTYTVEIIEQVVSNLSRDGVIPAEVGFMIKFVPVQTIVEFMMKIVKSPPSQPVGEPHEVLKMLSVQHHTGVSC